ncbi:MAG: recombinase family protein [Pacificimonas sp.]|jgi:DNA invertase Pin-like site-specific DNA recombinase|nr:recombinase family protein [Pacificimonas sp.]
MSKRKSIRCALYTRTSSDEGLDQAFNSLDAQREACESYVKSQAAEGWTALSARYDDGGISGGTMERPALKKLLADIERGWIDTVVVYKIDRLTRSLADFAKMVELFDRHGVSFVSVTQQFNTTSSMGRLTLNILLSFAQFEREVTGERIRDKIAASKKKGLWMGGLVPLGFDKPEGNDRILRINKAEADTVRRVFDGYLELGCLTRVRELLKAEGTVSKKRVSASGRTSGGVPLTRGRIAHLLKNPVYIGRIRHKGKVHEGGHEAIVDEATFDAIQRKLAEGARRQNESKSRVARSPLVGRIFDADGEAMTPAFSYGRAGKIYRYYVSAPLQQGKTLPPDEHVVRRVPAPEIESIVRELLSRLTKSDNLKHARSVTVHPDAWRLG